MVSSCFPLLCLLCWASPAFGLTGVVRDLKSGKTSKKSKKSKKHKKQVEPTCETPLEAVMNTLQCVAAKDAECLAASYSPDFVFLHNDVPAPSALGEYTSVVFWEHAFLFVTFALDLHYVQEEVSAEKYQVSIRYVEHVTTSDGSDFGMPPSSEYPFSQVFEQHEHALISLDAGCQISEWSQYGDNVEQQSVHEAVSAMMDVVF